MNANEAREIARKVNTNDFDSVWAEVKKLIKIKAEQGEYSLWVYKTLNEDVIQKLKEEGFTLTSQSVKNESSTNISW